MKETLYEIAAALKAELANAFDPETGEIDPEAEARILALEGDRDHKALDVIAYAKNVRMKLAGIKGMKEYVNAQLDGIRAEERACERQLDWTGDYLRMNGLEGINLKDSRGSVYWKKYRGVLVSEDADLSQWPEDCVRHTRAPLKTKALEHIDAGEPLPGATVIEKVTPVIK